VPKNRRLHPAVEAYIREMTSKGGRTRSANLTPKRRRNIAAKGGRAAWAGISAEERSARMRAVIRARWAKRKKRKP
jgi:general stress protein YciG